MSGHVIHATFWSSLIEFLGLIVLPLVIYHWPRRDARDKARSRELPNAKPREDRAAYVNMKMERFEKPR